MWKWPFFSAINHTFFWRTPRPSTGHFLHHLQGRIRGTSVPIYLIRLPKRCGTWRRSSPAPPAKRIACHRLPDGETRRFQQSCIFLLRFFFLEASYYSEGRFRSQNHEAQLHSSSITKSNLKIPNEVFE